MPFDATPITSPVMEALRESRAQVERGWCQHQGCSVDPDTHRISVCALGAIVSRDLPGSLPLLIRALGAETSADIAVWNDAPERTQADVLALYDKAIELAVAELLETANAGH